MDHTQQPFTCVEWCAGCAGFHLGLSRVIPALRVIAFSEIEAYAVANLVAKMEAGLLDPAPIWTDVKTFPCGAFCNCVDILCAGYPCQPFSGIGKRRGASDPRHLWPYILSGIEIIRPHFCFFENVEGHISLGLETVLADLAAAGYRATWGLFSALEVGATHFRKRVFILAQRAPSMADGEQPRLERYAGHGHEAGGRSEPDRSTPEGGICLPDAPPRPGDFDKWEHVLDIAPDLEPAICRMAHGATNRLDRLRLCGNGVVPATVAKAFITLFNELNLCN